VSITATGGLRVHAANGKRTGPDNPACPGSGQKPKEAQAGPVRFLCRVPAGPGGCGHEVQLTANHRARSHLNGQDQPCGGGSDWPLAVGQPESLTSDTTGWDDEDWEAVLGRPEPSLGDVFAGEARNETIRPTEVVDLPHDRQPDPHRYEADVAIAEAERIQREQDAQYEESIRDGLEESRRRINDSVPLLNRTGPIQVCTCSTGSPSNYEGPAADCPVHGGEALTDPDTLMVRPDADPTLFDPTHVLSTELGPEVHPGEASACRLPGCCTHPQGFEYGDDGHGHSGSVCMFCGAQEPECCTHPDGRTYGGTDENGEDVWACERCGEREDPAVTRMKAHGRARCTVADLDEGAFFVRHTAKAPLDKLVYRVRTHLLPRTATIVTPGPFLDRTGTLTNLTEEVTCTDQTGRAVPRRGRASGTTSPSTPSPGPRSTPSPPAATPTQVSTTVPVPGSRLTTKASVPAATSTTSSPGTVSGRTAGDSGGTSTRTAPVADAFSTPKQAVNQSEKYDSYGRYKILHPDSSKKVNWTRATTFCKSIQDTYALSMWSQRMVLKGASVRSDLTAAAGTLEVKADKDRMNGLVDEAKKAAGDKIAANKGTAVHAYTEELDKIGLDKVSELKGVPDEFVPTVQAYAAILNDFGLEPVPLLTEFTTAVKQYEVAGTSDNCYRVTRDITVSLNGRPVTLYAGEYVISDKKTGADLSYGWQEIAIQLALYSQGLNTSGVWDWGTRTWGRPADANGVQIQVRTDIGLVPHLPVDRSATGAPLATLYAVDLTAGWAAAVLCAQVRSWRKERKLATPLEVADLIGDRMIPVRVHPDPDENRSAPVSRPAPASRPVTLADKARAVTSRAEASAVYQEAVAARTPVAEVKALVQLMQDKLKSFTEQGA
jgi:hypothetical protein